MRSARLEAFSDGVLAVIITIMVLELKLPEGHSLGAFFHHTGLSLVTYLLSFVYVGIYWSNHHHLFHVAEQVDGAVLWANLHLLFWLSLIPFSTAWMSEHRFPPIPTAVYGIVLLGAAIAYVILQTALLRAEGEDSRLRIAIGTDTKGKISPFLYCLGIGLSFAEPWLGLVMYVLVALIWLVPDRRLERHLTAAPADPRE